MLNIFSVVRTGSDSGAMCVARVLARDLSYKWAHIVLQLRQPTSVEGDSFIVCSVQLIDGRQVSAFRTQCHQYANLALKSYKHRLQDASAAMCTSDVNNMAIGGARMVEREVLQLRPKELMQSRLKRKMEQQHCGVKQARIATRDAHDNGSGFDIDDFLSTANTTSFAPLLPFQSIDSIDYGNVMTQHEVSAPVYEHLKMADRTARRAPVYNSKVNSLTSTASTGSPGPLTPESFASELVTSPGSMLSVDVSDSVFGQLSYSSPNASPRTSPRRTSEQCVPTFVEEVDSVIQADRSRMTSQNRIKAAQLSPQQHLPELDAADVNTFFFAIDAKKDGGRPEVEVDLTTIFTDFAAASTTQHDVTAIDIDMSEFDWRQMATLASPSYGKHLHFPPNLYLTHLSLMSSSYCFR